MLGESSYLDLLEEELKSLGHRLTKIENLDIKLSTRGGGNEINYHDNPNFGTLLFYVFHYEPTHSLNGHPSMTYFIFFLWE